MDKKVDSYKFVSGITKRLIKSWIAKEESRQIPWTPLKKPIRESKVALISSAGIALKGDVPFDQEGERRNPWWGDTSYRVIPKEAKTEDIEVYHLHINAIYGRRDMNCLLPLQRLITLEEEGEVGRTAQRHYSFMGYCPQPQALIEVSSPRMIHTLAEDEVDIVVLVPS